MYISMLTRIRAASGSGEGSKTTEKERTETEGGDNMTKVMCAEIECKHYSDKGCKAKEIKISAGHMHTVHEGFRHVWTCKTYEMSEESKQIHEELHEFFKTKGEP